MKRIKVEVKEYIKEVDVDVDDDDDLEERSEHKIKPTGGDLIQVFQKINSVTP